ncbi:MAG: sulfatase-like hydrolase/transferase [bacterium]
MKVTICCLLSFATSALALGLGMASTANANDIERADSLVLIVADDLGIDRVGCYADAAARTPNIDQLATEGTRFETCWAAPRCTPARGMILTGQFPYRTGIGGKMKPSDSFDLSLPNLADLSTSGRAQLIGKWHLIQDVNAPGLLGFEHRGSMKNLAKNENYFRWWKNVEGRLQPSFLYVTTDNVDEAIGILKEGETPFKVRTVIVRQRCMNGINWEDKRDFWWHDVMQEAEADCPCVPLD